MISNLILRHDPAHCPRVFLVDDRPADMIMVSRLCASIGVPVEVFDSPVNFLREVPADASGCLIVDLLMPEMSGLELFDALKKRNIHLATIVATGFADATSCRAGFQAGVFDFIEKDFSPEELLKVINAALTENRKRWTRRLIRDARWRRIEALTNREMDVALLLNEGFTLKEIGSRLKISVQTASKHRTSIFDKLEVNNEVELHQAFADCNDLLDATVSCNG